MKAYTDIEQSHKLAEILPIESADMYLDYNFHGQKYEYYLRVMDDQFDDVCIPCWSLAALLCVIHQEIFNGKYVINITKSINHKWLITYDSYGHNKSFRSLGVSDNRLVDACVAMVEKLHERNLL